MKRFPRTRVRAFVARLAQRPVALDCTNPYSDPALARNLERYLEATWRDPAYRGLLLVGEALGYRGGVHTGIPFSSGAIYEQATGDAAAHPFLAALAPRLELHNAVAESTASIVWRYLAGQRELPLFWNAFPWHPCRPAAPQSNRKPRAAEVDEGAARLRDLVALFRPARIAGVGRAGQELAQTVFPEQEVVYLRHPSHGGAREFARGMDRLLR